MKTRVHRADMENRIAELKHDLGADRFCLKDFHATDAVFRSILLLFNLLSEFRRVSGMPQHKEPATLRSEVFLCGAEMKREGDNLILSLAAGWGGLKRRIPLITVNARESPEPEWANRSVKAPA